MGNQRFSIIPAKAISDKRISNAQLRTLAALGVYGDKNGWCYPKLSTLAEDFSTLLPLFSIRVTNRPSALLPSAQLYALLSLLTLPIILVVIGFKFSNYSPYA